MTESVVCNDERVLYIRIFLIVRGELFALAVAPLEKARSLYESAGTDVEAICQFMLPSYVQSGQMDEVANVQACAGYA